MTNKIKSFDIFDTAIIRKVYHPTDIFKVIEEKVGGDFYNKRIQAEQFAREDKKFYGIKDIYKYLPEFDMSDEIEAEFENCTANIDILRQYDSENTVFISDMYLPSKILKQILENAGYKNPEVYVSCELNACKAEGKLFKKVEKKTGKKIAVHYGDNYVADIEGAKKAGIKRTVFNPALHKKNLNIPKVKNPYLKQYLAIVEDRFEPIEKLALYYTPVIFEFTRWVLQNREEGQKIFFLSRDMYMPYLIAKDIFKAEDIYYLHVSRRSLAGLCLKSGNKELKRKMSFIFTKEELKQKKLQDDSEVLKYLKQFNIKDNDIIADIGYAGTIQAGIDYALKVKTQGFYMQVSSKVISGLKTKMFLNRMAIHFCLMVEFVFGSPEDNIEGYKNGKPVFTPDNKERKELARRIINNVLEMSEVFYFDYFIAGRKINIYDIEQILIHQQYYPSEELIKIYNKKIYTNRERKESIIGFDKAEIKKGNLRMAYLCSYCQPLFKKLLEQDKELKHLSKLVGG